MSLMAGNTTSLNVRIDGDVDPYAREVRKAEAATRSYEKSLESLNRDMMALEKQLDDDINQRLQKRNQAFTTTGRGMVIAGGAMLVGAGFAVKAAMDWETAWRGVQKVVTGTPEEMDALENSLRDLARTLPATHEEIAATAAAAGQLGIQRESIAEFTKTMIMMGTATNLSSDEAATAIARFMNVMQSASTDVDNIGSTIVGLGNKGASTEAEIVSMAQRVAGAGSLIGASQQDVLGLASAMANLGIQSELGGGAMQRVLTIIYSAAKKGGSAILGFADVAGMSAHQFADAWEKDPVKAFNAFLVGLNRVKDSGGDVVGTLAELGIKGTQNLQVLLRLAGSGDMLTKSLKDSNQAWKDNNALTKEAELRYQTTASQMQIAQNNLNDVAIDIGASLLPPLVKLLQLISNVAMGFGQLPGPIKAVIGPATVLLGLITLLGGAFLMAIPKVAAFNAAIEAGSAGAALTRMGVGIQGLAGALMGPWGIALAAGAAALTIFAAKQGQASQAVNEVKESLDEQTGAITENTREWAVKKLQDTGAFEDAKKLGLGLDVVTDAALGNTAAIALVNAKYEEYQAKIAAAGLAGGAHAGTAAMLDDNARAATHLHSTLGDMNGDLADAGAKFKDADAAMGDMKKGADATGDSVKNVSGAEGELGSETSKTTDEMDEQVVSAGKLMKALHALNDAVLGARSGARDYQETLEASRKTIKEGARTLNIHTEAGRENQAALDAIADSTLSWADAAGKADKSGQQSFQILRQGRKDLIATAQQFGFTAGEARNLADRILKIPKKWETAFTANTAAARAQIEGFVSGANASLAGIQNQTIDIMLQRHRVGPAMAGGGAVYGHGSATSDSIPARLSNGEHVWTAREVRAAGGQGAVRAMRREVLSGGAREVASVGRVAGSGAYTGDRGGSSGPTRISGVLTIPGFGEAFIRGIVQDEISEESSYADALAGRSRR